MPKTLIREREMKCQKEIREMVDLRFIDENSLAGSKKERSLGVNRTQTTTAVKMLPDIKNLKTGGKVYNEFTVKLESVYI